MARKPPPEAFRRFCANWHQDMNIHSSLDDAVAFMLGCVPKSAHEELAAYLAQSLDTELDADLKGILNRNIKDARFSSKGARTFFEAALRAVNRSIGKS